MNSLGLSSELTKEFYVDDDKITLTLRTWNVKADPGKGIYRKNFNNPQEFLMGVFKVVNMTVNHKGRSLPLADFKQEQKDCLNRFASANRKFARIVKIFNEIGDNDVRDMTNEQKRFLKSLELLDASKVRCKAFLQDAKLYEDRGFKYNNGESLFEVIPNEKIEELQGFFDQYAY